MSFINDFLVWLPYFKLLQIFIKSISSNYKKRAPRAWSDSEISNQLPAQSAVSFCPCSPALLVNRADRCFTDCSSFWTLNLNYLSAQGIDRREQEPKKTAVTSFLCQKKWKDNVACSYQRVVFSKPVKPDFPNWTLVLLYREQLAFLTSWD